MLKLVVFSCLVAAACAGALFAPLGYSAPLAYTAPLAYGAYGFAGANYRGPLSLAPGQPANIIAADGRPLDTLDVNLDRSSHIVAKAFNGHLLKKRSVVAPIAPFATIAHAPLIAPAHFGINRIAPFAPYARLAHYGAYGAYSAYAPYW